MTGEQILDGLASLALGGCEVVGLAGMILCGLVIAVDATYQLRGRR